VPNRSDYGEISYRDWYSPGGFEFGYLAPDPVDANIVFAGGWYRTVVRFDRRTGQVVTVFAPGTKYRSMNNAPMAFAPQDPHTLYYGTQYMMTTSDGGMTWKEISPDLTTPRTSSDGTRAPAMPAITTFSLSTVKAGVIWAATNTGVVQMTADSGATWKDVSPSGLPAGGAFEIIDAGRHDAATAFATFIVPQDMHPYIYRTIDGGASWTPIVRGLPETAFARVVREDPVRRGLLYCGTESGVFVSFDNGDTWQSLQLNLPASSMRDMVVHGDDLVVATYGRALWILDDVGPLRQASAASATDVTLLKPAPAVRAHWDVYGDTPLPVETPTAANPPEGGIVDYTLASLPAGDLMLTVSDSRGRVVRTFTSRAPADSSLLANVPSYWFAPPPVLTKDRGLNRFAWDLRYPNPKVLPFGYFGALLPYVEYTLADHAIPGRTPRDQPQGPLALPGEYTIELVAGDRHLRQTLTVQPDPRVSASADDLGAQFDLASRVMDALAVTFDGYTALKPVASSVAERRQSAAHDSNAVKVLDALEKNIESVQNGTTATPGLGVINREMTRVYEMIVSGDARPSGPLRAAVADACRSLTAALERWRQVNATDIPTANKTLGRAKLPPLQLAPVAAAPECMP